MRLVIDLQGAQGSSHGRGIGRLSRSLAMAMAAAPGSHEPIILLNEAMPDTAEALSDDFATILPRENIRFWRGLTSLGLSGGVGNTARRHASEVIRAQCLAGLNADFIHVASVVEGASDDVVSSWPAGLERPPHVATFYDAIPLIRRDQYLLGAWKEWGLTDWYWRQLQELRQCDALLAISESSRREAIDYLGCDPARVYNMRAGFDGKIFRPVRLEGEAGAALLARHGLREDFILFVGAGDLRKNDLGLLQAYALLPKALRVKHQLVIVGAMDAVALRTQAELLQVEPFELALLRHVSEEDLPILYSTCRVFVMPSIHEGFGLPALEAMACGAPVIASNTTSLPEVVGWEKALFDPHEPADIARRLIAVLTDDVFRIQLAEHGLARAAGFTWTESARRAWKALDEVQELGTLSVVPARGTVPRRKPRLACVGPLPPDASGISDYTRDLLPDLARYYDITLVTQSGNTDDAALQGLFPILSEDRFALVGQEFDRILYQIGNSEFHSGIVQRLLPSHPGVAVMHDAYLCNIPLVDFLLSRDEDALARALFESHGWRAVQAMGEQPPALAVQQFPCALPVFRNALGIIQHSSHARDIVFRNSGPDAAAMVRLVPFVRASWPHTDRQAARATLGLDANMPLICTFGIVSGTKRPLDVLEVWQAAMREEPQARLAFVGAISAELAADLKQRAKQFGCSNRLILTGRVNEARYRLWLGAADIAVQLRKGSRGETSASIADAMCASLPVIANAHGSAAELPPNAVLLLPDAADNAEIAAALGALWAEPARRKALGQAAAAYVRQSLSPRVVAQLYHEAIENAYAMGAPARLRAALPALPEDDLLQAARALMQSFPVIAPKRLLLDASCLSDASSDIGGILRELAKRLLPDPGEEWIADLVRFDGGTLRHARECAAKILGLSRRGLQDLPVSGGPGDILVLVANTKPVTTEGMSGLRHLRRQGVRVVGLFCDIPPLRRSQKPLSEQKPHENLRNILGIADAVLCTSRILVEDIVSCLNSGDLERRRPLDLSWFDLGLNYSISAAEPEKDAEIPLDGLDRREVGERSTLREERTLNRAESAKAFLCALQSEKWQMCWMPPPNRL